PKAVHKTNETYHTMLLGDKKRSLAHSCQIQYTNTESGRPSTLFQTLLNCKLWPDTVYKYKIRRALYIVSNTTKTSLKFHYYIIVTQNTIQCLSSLDKPCYSCS
ncbi:hypothetical protein PanWU01x14_199330, partial [Parasponia andersonii]